MMYMYPNLFIIYLKFKCNRIAKSVYPTLYIEGGEEVETVSES